MERLKWIFAALTLQLCAAPLASSQVATPGSLQTGFPPFSSIARNVNLSNLDFHYIIPVLHKNGRGIPLTQDITYDSTIYGTATVGNETFFTISATAGFNFPSSASLGGGISNTRTQGCGSDQTQTNYSNWIYTDPAGTPHLLPSSITVSTDPACGPAQASSFAVDQSGYFITVKNDGTSTALSPSGTFIGSTVNASGLPASAPPVDRNGNMISQNVSGNSNTFTLTTTTTDTLGVTALTETDTFVPNTPLAASQSFTYPVPGNPTDTTASVTVNYKTYPQLATGFGCNGIGDNLVNGSPPFPAPGVAMEDNIVLADGSKYSFTYEPTPNSSPFWVAGSITGRLVSMTLPTGAMISFAYPGANGGINCNDGSAMGLSITTSDGTWTYARSVVGTNFFNETSSTTTITDPQNNQTVVSFVPLNNPQIPVSPSEASSFDTPSWVETSRSIYQGTSSKGTLLQTIITCYNGVKSNCSAGPVTMPITEVSKFVLLPNGQENEVDTFFSSTIAEVLEVDEYDFGSGGPGALLRKTVTTYASLGNNILTMPQTVTICSPGGSSPSCKGPGASGGTQVAQTTFGYDETARSASGATQHVSVSGSRGNLTSIHRWLNSTNTTLNTVNTFDDAGNILTTTDPNGNLPTRLSYSCNDALVSTVTLPDTQSGGTTTHHTMSSTFDCNTGLLVSSTDQNNNTTNYLYDEMLRPTQVTYPDGGQTTWSYPNANDIKVENKINDSNSVSTTTVLDGYGRVQETQLSTPDCANAINAIKVDTSYDSLGRVFSVTNPFCQTSDPTYGITSTQYDALNRVTQVTHPDGTTVLTSYSGRAAETQDEGNGNSRVTHIVQADGLGRVASVCEVTSVNLAVGNNPAACNLDIAGKGFLTTYTHDLLGNLTGVSQGAISRSFNYDSLSRLLSETNPESGTTSYTYDNNGNVLTRLRAAPNQGNPNTTVTTTYVYDALNRLTQKSYNDGKTATVKFLYDVPSSFSNPTPNQPNLVGRLSEAYLSTSPQGNTVFGYDAMGRIVTNSRCTPLNCGSGNWPINYTYDLAGNVLTATNGLGTTFTYQYDSIGRLSSMDSSLSDSNHPGTLYSGLQYNSIGALTGASLGNTLNEIFKWDCRGRILAYSSALQPTQPSLSLSNTSGCPNTSAMDVAPAAPGLPNRFFRAAGFSRSPPTQTSVLLTSHPTTGKAHDHGSVTLTLISFDLRRGSENIRASYGEGETALEIAQKLARQINGARFYGLSAAARPLGSAAALELSSQGDPVLSDLSAFVSVSSNQSEPSISATVLPSRKTSARPPGLLGQLGNLASRQQEAK